MINIGCTSIHSHSSANQQYFNGLKKTITSTMMSYSAKIIEIEHMRIIIIAGNGKCFLELDTELREINSVI